MRRVASSEEFFDILDRIGNGKFVTIGYVTGANLNVPTIKRRNPETNRMKGYPDFSVFGAEGEDEIGALVKITSYNMRYLNRETVGKKYGEFKDAANAIRGNFGLDPIASKESYKQGTSWSPNGPELYKGQNTELQSHSYNPQNIHGVTPKGIVYAVNTEGHIIKELTPEQVQPYLKAKREVDGVAALRKMGAEEEKIQDYIEQIKNLKFKYINFESNSILWIAATINGEKIIYINDNLARAVDGIDIRPEDFREIARERYQIDLSSLQEMASRMSNRKLIRLTESDLHSIIENAVRKIISEGWNSNLSPDALDDKAYMDDLRAQRDRMFDDAWEDKNRRIRQKYPGKSPEWYEAMLDVFESKNPQETINEESFQNNQNYTHFAVSKRSGKILNGWDYSEYDPSELRQFKKDYFDVDMQDYGFDPKSYKIVTGKYLLRQGVDPDDNSNWANNDEANADWIG